MLIAQPVEAVEGEGMSDASLINFANWLASCPASFTDSEILNPNLSSCLSSISDKVIGSSVTGIEVNEAVKLQGTYS